ncbi:MAG: YciI family protein [Pseudomonadota bacterium]
MKFAVIFEDDPEADPTLRAQGMEAHLAFLEASGAVEAAGPLPAAGEAGPGGLWIVEAEDAAAVERLVREDPFWTAGLRRSHAVRPWRQVFAGGRRVGA